MFSYHIRVVTKVTSCMTCNLKNSLSVVMLKDDFHVSSASQTLTLAPSTPILPLHDPSYSNIHSSPPPSIPSPSILSPNSSVPDSPTKSNLIPPDTSVSLRRSTRTKQPPACYNDYEMSSRANHLTSSSSPNTVTRFPLHHYLSFSRFFSYSTCFSSSYYSPDRTYNL